MRNVIQWHWNCFFSKNRLAAESFANKTPIASDCWRLCPQPPSLIRLSYTSLLNTFPNLDILTFGKPGRGIWFSILWYLCSTIRFSFENLWKFCDRFSATPAGQISFFSPRTGSHSLFEQLHTKFFHLCWLLNLQICTFPPFFSALLIFRVYLLKSLKRKLFKSAPTLSTVRNIILYLFHRKYLLN